MKPNHSDLRPFGQTTLRFQDKQPIPSKQSVSLSEFFNRKLPKASNKSIKEKKGSFSSIGFGSKDWRSEKDKVAGNLILNEAIFKRFNTSVKETNDVGIESEISESCEDSRKRKNPFGVSSGDHERQTAPKYLVVLGDDPKPRPKRREMRITNRRDKPLYNHYANGCGWWECEREGVDSEEVGCNEVWEGMGSTTLGGLEWH
ncbi:uncharacterized protein [Typha latifolia]|uniref:uncharacterized protein n=1 Tax=Typha latifolia TaxID=4733 RepID=UPI003C2EC0A4